MTKFSETEISEVAQVIDCPHSTPKWVPNGILAVRNFNLENGKIVFTKASYVSDETFAERTKRAIPEKGDIIISREAPIGSIGYVDFDEKICLGQRVVLIKPENINGHFLKYVMLSPYVQHQFKASDGSGSTVSNLRIPLIKKTKIPFPTKEIQHKIVDVLVSYDDLISNLDTRIQKLEKFSKSLYWEWFVNYKFPDCQKVKFTDSGTEYGKIPDGWKVAQIGDQIKLPKGKNITKKTLKDGGVPVVAGGLKPAYHHAEANTKNPVVTISASGANSGYVNLYLEDVWASDCSYIDLSVTPYVYFYYLLLKTRQHEVTHLQRGSAQPHVYPKDIMGLMMIIPPQERIAEFCELVAPIFDLIRNLNLQVNNLTRTRDLLIPKLVTGEIEIRPSNIDFSQ